MLIFILLIYYCWILMCKYFWVLSNIFSNVVIPFILFNIALYFFLILSCILSVAYLFHNFAMHFDCIYLCMAEYRHSLFFRPPDNFPRGKQESKSREKTCGRNPWGNTVFFGILTVCNRVNIPILGPIIIIV